jgi:hypothetical protein
MSTTVSAPPRGLSQLNGTMPEWSKRAERTPLLDFVDSCLRGIGQVCFTNNPVTGLLILVAMFIGEAWLGFAGALGLVVSVGGVFFVLTWRSGVLAVACAVFAAMLFGAIASLFTPWGLPALTLPFVFATLAFVLLKGASETLRPVEVADITTPEEHLARGPGEHSAGVGRDAVREFPEAEPEPVESDGH